MAPIFTKSIAPGLSLCVVLCLVTSVHGKEALQPLVQVWVTPKPLAAVETCVIEALDANQRTYSNISPSVKHVIKVRVPGSVVEIRPSKAKVVADIAHYVRLEKIADGITRIAFYSSDKSKRSMATALISCGPK